MKLRIRLTPVDQFSLLCDIAKTIAIGVASIALMDLARMALEAKG